MQLNEINIVTKSLFREAFVETSSDFIVTAYKLSREIKTDLWEKIDPIYRWEYSNWHSDYTNNTKFIERKMNNLDVSDYVEIGQAYTDVLDYFLTEYPITSIFKMDGNDVVGWQIYKELTHKRNYSTKMFNIAITKEYA